jgi:hypothetical protein
MKVLYSRRSALRVFGVAAASTTVVPRLLAADLPQVVHKTPIAVAVQAGPITCPPRVKPPIQGVSAFTLLA